MVTASEEGTESGEAASLEAEEEEVLPEVFNGESYLHIDQDIQCFNDEDVLEDDIVEAVSSKRLCQSEDGSEDEDSDPDEEVAQNNPCSSQVLCTTVAAILRQTRCQRCISRCHRYVRGRSRSKGKC